MKIALIDPFAGIAGDMLVGALLDAGASFKAVRTALDSLGLKDVSVASRDVPRCGLLVKKFVVEATEEHHHRGLSKIIEIIDRGELSPGARERSRSAFELLAQAESKVHGVKVEQIHFHEVGAVDSICDIVGAAVALDDLGIDRIYCRPLPLSTGWVRTEHGRMPIPAPATMELLKGWETYDSGLEGELITPTGAACVAAWAQRGAPPRFVPDAIGYGAGDRNPDQYPNVTRVTVGETSKVDDGPLYELVCEIDDATPQVLGHLLERLLESGALDASLQPVLMKKDRPGTRVTALAPLRAIPTLEKVLFVEGTTLGVRRRPVERTELPRTIVSVETKYGPVRLKVARMGNKVVHVAPEYEDCRALARERGVPLREVARAAVAEYDA
ncbi:MAG: nickel pincer cofactor biosynthesis protein LarC [Planctomycetota bacterium]|nr:nickel pincer cofactor biosynthesis protein LarC [Planctomycetota bacterium]